MTIKYRYRGLNKDAAQSAIELAYHIIQIANYQDVYNASNDGIQRANYKEWQEWHGKKADEIIKKTFGCRANLII